MPEIPYTSEDLQYSDDGHRANQERSDPAARPVISGGVDNMEARRYDALEDNWRWSAVG